MSADKYAKASAENVELKLAKSNWRIPYRCNTPMSTTYHPSEDVTKEMNADGLQVYQELIGILRWAVEIGRVEIILDVPLLSSQPSLPHVGHLQAL